MRGKEVSILHTNIHMYVHTYISTHTHTHTHIDNYIHTYNYRQVPKVSQISDMLFIFRSSKESTKFTQNISQLR